MKKILITGKNSYIGTSFEKWLSKEPNQYQIDTIDMKDGSWKEHDFSPYDVVFHVAGIAHVSADPKLKDLYYQVNTDLAIETAKKSKEEGVKQFIFMSSIIVYGDSNRKQTIITRETKANPSNFYGDSKLQAELGISPLADDKFKVVILRPPMIYGKDSKGNYPRLSKFAQKSPIFPDFKNKRSMLHIDNLTEFLKQVIDHEATGLFFPQNKEYVCTSELVKTIAEVHGNKIILTKVFNPFIKLLFNVLVINKMFGDLVYDKGISNYNFIYNEQEFISTVKKTEVKI